MSTLTPKSSSATKCLALILLGPPGSGKGTQASPLCHHFGIPHVSTGDILREHIRNQTLLGKEAKRFMDIGKLVPDHLVLEMLFERISLPDCKQGYLLDGFPRTVVQAKELDLRLNEDNQLIVFSLHLKEEMLIERLVGRLSCKGCNKPYHRQFNAPKKNGICDLCESALYQRDDDREDIVRKRLAVYAEQTAPLLQYYRQKPDTLQEIDSVGTREEVLEKMLSALNSVCWHDREQNLLLHIEERLPLL